MIKIVFNVFLLLFVIKSSVNSQTNNFCSFDDLLLKNKDIEENTPSFDQVVFRTDEALCIRTVVHIIDSNTQESITDSFIEDLINKLNHLLTTQDIDTSFIHPNHRSLLTDAEIQFHLAQLDPENNQTNGITRTESDIEYFSPPILQNSIYIEQVKQDSLGGKSAWDTERYLNIWIAPMSDSSQSYNYGIPDSTFFPLGTSGIIGSGITGVVIDKDNILDSSTPNVLCHEIGHALGLFHHWGYPSFSCEIDDYIEDTPVSKIGSICLGNQNTCLDSINDKVDNASNIMGYSCMLMFTPNQIETIKSNIINNASNLIIENEVCEQITSTSNPNPELSVESISTISPNPNNGIFTVQYSQRETADISIDFFNSLGNLIKSETILNSNSFHKEFDLSAVQSGVLIMVITSKSIVHSRKIIIHK